MRIVVVVLALGAVAAALVSCGSGEPPARAPSPDGSWVLVEGQGPEGPVPLVDGAEVTLHVSGADWSGTAACNQYGATVDVDGPSVEVRALHHTEMACPEEGVMASEAAYLRAFGEVTGFERVDRRLVLTGPQVRLVYEPGS